MNQTIYYLCRHVVGMMDGWHPSPARLIAEQTKEYKMAQGKERKILQNVFGEVMFPDNLDAKGAEQCV